MNRMIPLSFGGFFALFFLVQFADASSAPRQAFQNLFGQTSLPVYYIPSGDPKAWVHKNSVHLIKRSADFEQIRQRINPRLSTACTLGRFNQRRVQQYFVLAKYNKKNVVILGYAHGRGTNLRDKSGLADVKQGYLFRYDGSGKCQVFAFN